MKPEDIPIFEALNDSEAAILTIDGEAENQPFAGKQAIAVVICNRVECQCEHHAKHDTVKDVCFGDKGDSGFTAPGQFSCFISGSEDYDRLVKIAQNIETWRTYDNWIQGCQEAWTGDNSEVAKLLNAATFYRVVGSRNPWFDNAVASGKLVKTAEIGKHTFYREA